MTPEKIRWQFAARLNWIRIYGRGWTQEELAERSGIVRAALGRLERGDAMPRLDTLIHLSRALGVSVEDLATGGPAGRHSGKPNPLLDRTTALDELLARLGEATREARRLVQEIAENVGGDLSPAVTVDFLAAEAAQLAAEAERKAEAERRAAEAVGAEPAG